MEARGSAMREFTELTRRTNAIKARTGIGFQCVADSIISAPLVGMRKKEEQFELCR